MEAWYRLRNCSGEALTRLSPMQNSDGRALGQRDGRLGRLVLASWIRGQDLALTAAVGIGGDPINGLKHIDVLQMFNDDPDTDAVIMIGEIGGPDEVNAARWAKDNMKKPVVGFIAGVTAPPGKRMGHAGALISGGADTADAKLEVMEACGIRTTRDPSEMGRLLKKVL